MGALEMIAVIGLFVGMIAMSAPYIAQWGNSRTDQITADQFKLAMQGANTFTQTNSAAIVAAANPTVVYSWAQIASSMPAGLSPTNPFGQTYQLAIQRTGSAPNYALNPMLQTVGGQPIPENEMRVISALVGGSGGYISTLSPTVASGARGGWGPLTLTAFGANPGSGRLAGALFYQTSTQANQYLYRVSVPGHPELQQMQAAIDMQSNNVNNAGTVSAQHVGVNEGTTTPSAIGIAKQAVFGDANNLVLQTAGTVYTRNTNWSAAADFQAQNIQAWNGSVNADHDVNAAGNVSAGNSVNSSGTIWANGQITTNNNLYLATSGAQITNPGRMHINVGENLYLQPWSGGKTIVGGGGGSGQLEVTGRLFADEYIQPNGWASPGAGCSPNGLIANSGSGPLFCQSGVWVSAGSVSTIAVDSGGWKSSAIAACPAPFTLTGGSCDMYRGDDGREIGPRTCAPLGNGYYCNEGNGGSCIAHAICAQ
ncbi:shufflon system plasmid conjugative transfer pilus tip adhesin PilV [Burkholderia ubonensis]|uniref:shufflon system plasmid conjugative transfer pilus tip adhesin PilV n=1 Tax=Burkholderia ubonensis TaxID=101571 RepID=UPI00075C2095|nr:shufflon system plasmid conjugative transfer pilus tip adhesin PilV [Burkholderia ubonensis]